MEQEIQVKAEFRQAEYFQSLFIGFQNLYILKFPDFFDSYLVANHFFSFFFLTVIYFYGYLQN